MYLSLSRLKKFYFDQTKKQPVYCFLRGYSTITKFGATFCWRQYKPLWKSTIILLTWKGFKLRNVWTVKRVETNFVSNVCHYDNVFHGVLSASVWKGRIYCTVVKLLLLQFVMYKLIVSQVTKQASLFTKTWNNNFTIFSVCTIMFFFCAVYVLLSYLLRTNPAHAIKVYCYFNTI